MSRLPRDRFGKIDKNPRIYIKPVVKEGSGMMIDLTPAEENINRVGGVPNIREKNAHLLPPPPFSSINNYKVQPKISYTATKALNSVKTPAGKKLNNLKFEL